MLLLQLKTAAAKGCGYCVDISGCVWYNIVIWGTSNIMEDTRNEPFQHKSKTGQQKGAL